MMRCVETILAAVERLPAVKLEIDDAHRSAGVRVGARLVARMISGTAVFSQPPRPSGSRLSNGAFRRLARLRTGSSSTSLTLKTIRKLSRRFAGG
jgi:cytochrome b561